MDNIFEMRIAMIIYLAIIVLIGMGMMWFVKGSGKRYIVCGKSIPFFILSTMLLAQALEANGTMGAAAMTYQYGYWSGWVLPAGVAMCLVVTGLFFARKLNNMNLLTLPDFYFRRYGPQAEWMSTLCMVLSFIVLVAGNFAGSGWIISILFNLEYGSALLIISALIFIYTICGGLFSSAGTNVVQMYPAVVGFIGGAGWLIYTYGWDYFLAGLPPDAAGSVSYFYDASGWLRVDNGALLNFASLMAVGIGDVIALDFMERVFAGKSGKIARNACFLSAGITLAVGSAAALYGLFAHSLMSEAGYVMEDIRMAMPWISLEVLPLGIGVLIMTGIIGAGASTASGGLVGVSTALGRNLYQKNLYRWWLKRRGITEIVHNSEEDRIKFDKRLLLISRVVTIPVTLFAIWLGYVKPEPGVLLVLAFDIGFASCVPALFLGVYWKKANSAGAVASILIGGISRLILYFTFPEDSRWLGIETFISPTLGLIAMFAFSLATQKAYPPKPQALTEQYSETQVLSGIA